MPKISEIFGIERDRKDSQKLNIIHLFKEGSFYHAYEWSAWLLVTFAYTETVRMTTSDRKPLNVTHNKIKDSKDTIAFVGFPLRSLEKFIPQDRQVSFTPINDNQIDIAIEIPAEFGEVSEERMQKMVEEWKSETPAKDPKESRAEKRDKTTDTPQQALPLPKGSGLISIVSQILSYPLEKKSPIEAFEFLSELKRQVAEVF